MEDLTLEQMIIKTCSRNKTPLPQKHDFIKANKTVIAELLQKEIVTSGQYVSRSIEKLFRDFGESIDATLREFLMAVLKEYRKANSIPT